MPNDVYGNLLASQGLPQYTEATRIGGGYHVMTATPFAPAAAVPTTTCKLEIFNNGSGSGANSLVIDTLYAFQLLGTAATQTYAIWAQVYTKAAPTNTALTIASDSGRPDITSGSSIITAVDTTVVAHGWRPWGNVQAWGTAAATPGNSWHAEVNGRLVVPPGAALCLSVVGSLATASTFHVGASWYNVSSLSVQA